MLRDSWRFQCIFDTVALVSHEYHQDIPWIYLFQFKNLWDSLRFSRIPDCFNVLLTMNRRCRRKLAIKSNEIVPSTANKPVAVEENFGGDLNARILNKHIFLFLIKLKPISRYFSKHEIFFWKWSKELLKPFLSLPPKNIFFPKLLLREILHFVRVKSPRLRSVRLPWRPGMFFLAL